MKKSIALLLFIVTSTIYAQNSGITYQAVIYNPSTEILPGNNNPNVVLANKEICLRFSIKDVASSLEYQEVQKVKTDEFGMVNLVVGQGNQISGYAANFGAIVWNSSNKTLAVAIDTNANCSNFIEVSEQFFSAVPFAYASKVAETVSGIVPIVNGGTGAATEAGAKTNLGLNNVDNTSDLNKPVSTATQNALDAKAPLASPGFTGVPTAPTAPTGTSTTQIATTAFVNAALATAAAPDATTTLKGRIQLAGDLSGTADAPTVPALANKENSANKSTNTSLGNSDILFPTQKAVKTYVDNQVSAGAADADTTRKGIIQLSGDLSGTADAPTVPGLLTKEPIITAGTNSQYYRGDKSWQTLDKSAVGLGNVDNTSDANKPVSTAIQAALNLKAPIESPTFTGTVSGITKGMVGLTNVNNTADLDKPVSTATQTELNAKENTITPGTTVQYFRGDKTWQTLDKTAVGLGNVNNTADLDKPVSTATLTALSAKENALNKSDITTLGTSDVLFPTQNAVKTYVDNQIVANATPDATLTVKGKIQLGGDLAGTGSSASSPVITNNAISTNKIATAAVTPAKIAPGSNNSVLVTDALGAVVWRDKSAFGAVADLNTIEGLGTPADPLKVKDLGIDTDKIKNNAVTNLKLDDNAVTNIKLGETISVAKGGTGATSLTGYLKGNGTNAFTSVSTIPVTDVTGAVRSVNGVLPDNTTGNVAVVIGRVFTGTAFNPNSAAAVITINSGPNPIKESDIYIVSGQSGTPNDNGRTFINDGTNWLEISTNVAALESTFVKLSGSTMAGNLDFPTGKKINIADAPTGSTDVVNKAYVDNLITSSTTPDATTSIIGKIKLAGDLGGTAAVPTVPGLALKAPLASPSLTGTPLAPTAAAGTNTQQIATTAFVTAATAGKQDAITLTTTGTGAASLVGSTLNIPTPNNGTVTNVAALTIGTSGTDITSTVATATTTPVVTLNVPTASAANRGALSATDWATFNNKIGGSGTATQVPFFSSSTNLTSAPEFTYNNTTKNLTVGLLNDNTTRFTVNGAIKGNADGGALLLQDGANNQIFRGLWNFFGSPLVSTQYFQMGNNNVAFTGFNGGKLTRASFRTDGFQISSQTDINIPNPVGVFEVRGATTPLMNVLANGNVGIGTTGPANKLEITQGTAGNSGLRFTNLTASSAATTASSKVLGLNSNGDVILTNVPGTQNIVSFSTVNPNSGSPTFTPAQSMDQSVVYQSSVDNSMWTYNGTTYVTYSPPASTAWNLANTTNDAGSNKTSGIFRTGNVGIGTNNPTTNLDVVGGFNLRNTAGAAGSNFGMEFNTNSSSPRIDWVYNGNYTGSFAGDADFFFRLQNSRLGTGGFRFMTNPSGTAVERMTILNNGNIGIGNINPTATLDVQSPLTSTFVTTARFLTPNNTTAGNSNVLNFGVTATTGNSADWRYVYQANGAASNRVDFGMSGYAAPMMSYLNSGNVGIGTTAPATRLHIQGQTATTTINADAQLLRFSRPGVSSIKWDHVAQFNLGAYSTNINANTRLDLALNDGSTLTPSNVMTWLANGNVGINNTAPSSPLVVQANTVGTGVLKLAVPSVGSDNWWMGFSHGINNSPDSNDRARIGVDIVSGGAGRLFFTTGLPGTQTRAMFIDELQRVGIGTLTPTSRLDVVSGTTDIARFTTSLSTSNYAGIGIGNGSGAWGKIAAGEGKFQIRNFSTDATIINAELGTGNVGIGTTSPTSRLEVNGSATNSAAFNSGSATAILFNNSNLAYTSASPTAFFLQGIKDGGTYTLAVQGTTSGTASFTAVGFNFKSINNGTTIAGKDTLYTFVVMGTTVYVYMATGF